MRVLVCSTAGAGHFSPLLPLAWACVTAGHQVRVAAPTSFSYTVTSSGFEHAPFDDVPTEIMGSIFGRLPSLSQDEANRVVIGEIFGRLDAQAALPGMRDIAKDWCPDLILREPCEFASLAVARHRGIAHATVAIGVRAMTDAVTDIVAAPLRELDELMEIPHGSCHIAMRTAPIFSTVPQLLDGPPSSPSPVRYRDQPANATGHLPLAWGNQKHPLVYVSLGSVAGSLASFKDIYRSILAALADQPIRVLLTTGHGLNPADLGAVPANTKVEQWWPQADVMPHAAAVVGHGGFGTTMCSLAAGVPQIVLPMFSLDQGLNAERVVAIGAGLSLEPNGEAMRALPNAVRSLLTDTSYKNAAAAAANEIAQLLPAEQIVPLLESLAALHQETATATDETP
ncbi:glycosyltransferase [Ornithinimicrobium cryptoxanthini]